MARPRGDIKIVDRSNGIIIILHCVLCSFAGNRSSPQYDHMIESFKCASCSAPLDFEGKTMQKCQFCGSTVIVPTEMLYRSGTAAFGDLSSLTGKAFKIAEIQQLIHDGKKIEAIKVFRETFGVGLKEAKDAVEAMEHGRSVDISGMQIRTANLASHAEYADAAKKIGYSIGGSILATVLLISVVTLAGVGAAFYFAFSAIDRTTKSITSNTATGPKEQNAKQPDALEVLRLGGEGIGGGRFKDNRHVAVDGNGRIYSADYSKGRMQVFDAEGKFLTEWAPQTGTNLYDLAADRKGNLYLANDKGVFMYEGETGKPLAQSERVYPRSIALRWDGSVAVAADKKIVILDTSLKTVTEHNNAGELANASAGFREIASDGNGNIYAIDQQNGDICKFSADVKFLNRFPIGSRSPNAIAIDPTGRIFISNTSNIDVFDENGRAVRSFETYQAFGMSFNEAGELLVASRPFVVKYKLNF